MAPEQRRCSFLRLDRGVLWVLGCLSAANFQNFVVGVFLFLFVASATLFAQLPTATILGVVKDSSGAVVPGVNLTARNVDTNQSRAVTTESDGSFRFSGASGRKLRSSHGKGRVSVRGPKRTDAHGFRRKP